MDFTVPEEIERLCEGVRRFMDEHVYPLEGVARGWKLEAGGPAYSPVIREVQQRAKALGYWAFHLPAEAGGAGIPFMHYVLVNEILGRSPLAPVCVGSQAPDSGNAEILWRYGSDQQKARWLRPLVAGEDPELLLHDRARGRRLRSEAAAYDGSPGRRPLDHQRTQVVHQRRARGVLRHRDGNDEP